MAIKCTILGAAKRLETTSAIPFRMTWMYQRNRFNCGDKAILPCGSWIRALHLCVIRCHNVWCYRAINGKSQLFYIGNVWCRQFTVECSRIEPDEMNVKLPIHFFPSPSDSIVALISHSTWSHWVLPATDRTQHKSTTFSIHQHNCYGTSRETVNSRKIENVFQNAYKYSRSQCQPMRSWNTAAPVWVWCHFV